MILWTVLGLTLASVSQESGPGPVQWKQLANLVGSWEGRETGLSGDGVGKRTCKLALGDTYLFCENSSTFPPQERNPQGEVHQDWMVWSYDRQRARFVGRQFNIESFVNKLVQDPAASDENRLVFVSELSENAPPGTRVRITYQFQGKNQFVETFELAWPGEDLTVYGTNHWSRAPATGEP